MLIKRMKKAKTFGSCSGSNGVKRLHKLIPKGRFVKKKLKFWKIIFMPVDGRISDSSALPRDGSQQRSLSNSRSYSLFPLRALIAQSDFITAIESVGG